MKVSEAIKRANDLRLNSLHDEQKAVWLNKLDGELSEILETEPPENNWPEEDAELLFPAPYDDLYVYYLIAQIDYYLMETAQYANDMALYNEAVSAAKAWWRRNHRPQASHNWRVF